MVADREVTIRAGVRGRSDRHHHLRLIARARWRRIKGVDVRACRVHRWIELVVRDRAGTAPRSAGIGATAQLREEVDRGAIFTDRHRPIGARVRAARLSDRYRGACAAARCRACHRIGVITGGHRRGIVLIARHRARTAPAAAGIRGAEGRQQAHRCTLVADREVTIRAGIRGGDFDDRDRRLITNTWRSAW